MVVSRGDIFFANLDPVIGAEQAGVRPVLVVQNDEANARIPTVSKVGHLSEALLEEIDRAIIIHLDLF